MLKRYLIRKRGEAPFSIYILVGSLYNLKVRTTPSFSINSVAIKIQKVFVDNIDTVVFSVNETEYSVKEGWASISLPSKTFAGKGKMQLL